MIKAVIDVGTNSVLLLVAEVAENGSVKVINQDFKISRLGTDLRKKGVLTNEAMQRALELIMVQVKMARDLNAGDIRIIGTEGLRRAANSEEFISNVQQLASVKLEIIDAGREAEYTYLGSIEGIKAENYIVIDVGGGSTEIICGQGFNIKEKFLLPLGAVFLAEKFNVVQKIDDALRASVLSFIATIINEVQLKGNIQEICLIGVGGTLSTLAMIQQSLKKYDDSAVHGYKLSLPVIHDLFKKINALNFKERVAILGVEKGREMYILFGILIFIGIMQKLNKNEIIASDRGVRFGAIKTRH